ncbi:MAG: hypothetical protein AB7S40_07385 [Bacteroidales bacterium]|jgi:hypothetical protein
MAADTKQTKRFIFGTPIWIGTLAIIALFLLLPATKNMFLSATASHPYLMGFVKFAILSIMGEFLAKRIVTGQWQMVGGVLQKMFVWGVLGVAIVLMFALYTGGVDSASASGLLYTGYPDIKILRAFYISAIMNLTFGPVFMAAHRITDTWIDSRVNAKKRKSVETVTENQMPSLGQVVSSIDWPGFVKFVVGKTIPLFWIPAHTITFLLPDQYKVIFAASLSIVLGLILSLAKNK